MQIEWQNNKKNLIQLENFYTERKIQNEMNQKLHKDNLLICNYNIIF